MKKRIFIFKNDEIGDFCLWFPFARKLRDLYPEHEIIIGGCGHFGVFIPWPEKYRHMTTFFSDCDNRGCNWVCSFSEQKKNEAYPCVKAVSPEPVWAAIGRFLEQEENK